MTEGRTTVQGKGANLSSLKCQARSLNQKGEEIERSASWRERLAKSETFQISTSPFIRRRFDRVPQISPGAAHRGGEGRRAGVKAENPRGDTGATQRVFVAAREGLRSTGAMARPVSSSRLKMEFPTSCGHHPCFRRGRHRMGRHKKPHVALMNKEPDGSMGLGP